MMAAFATMPVGYGDGYGYGNGDGNGSGDGDGTCILLRRMRGETATGIGRPVGTP